MVNENFKNKHLCIDFIYTKCFFKCYHKQNRVTTTRLSLFKNLKQVSDEDKKPLITEWLKEVIS